MSWLRLSWEVFLEEKMEFPCRHTNPWLCYFHSDFNSQSTGIYISKCPTSHAIQGDASSSLQLGSSRSRSIFLLLLYRQQTGCLIFAITRSCWVVLTSFHQFLGSYEWADHAFTFSGVESVLHFGVYHSSALDQWSHRSLSNSTIVLVFFSSSTLWNDSVCCTFVRCFEHHLGTKSVGWLSLHLFHHLRWFDSWSRWWRGRDTLWYHLPLRSRMRGLLGCSTMGLHRKKWFNALPWFFSDLGSRPTSARCIHLLRQTPPRYTHIYTSIYYTLMVFCSHWSASSMLNPHIMFRPKYKTSLPHLTLM